MKLTREVELARGIETEAAPDGQQRLGHRRDRSSPAPAAGGRRVLRVGSLCRPRVGTMADVAVTHRRRRGRRGGGARLPEWNPAELPNLSAVRRLSPLVS